jgi:hypothetical protein
MPTGEEFAGGLDDLLDRVRIGDANVLPHVHIFLLSTDMPVTNNISTSNTRPGSLTRHVIGKSMEHL